MNVDPPTLRLRRVKMLSVWNHGTKVRATDCAGNPEKGEMEKIPDLAVKGE